MPILLLIRHGENDVMHRRLAGRMTGVHLNTVGQSQAAGLVAGLKEIPIRAIYSSPLERALETAAPLAAARRLPIQVQPGLLEIDYGAWQGRTYKQLGRSNLWKILHQQPSRVRFPAGETLAEAQARVVLALAQVAGQHSEKDVLACFTHADVVRLAVAHFLNLALDDFQRLHISPAGCTAVMLGGEVPRLLYINQTWITPPDKRT